MLGINTVSVNPNEEEVYGFDDRDDMPFEPDEESLEEWAKHYDDLNGAPEGEWDR